MKTQLSRNIRVLIVDDELPARQLLRKLLDSEPLFEIVGEAVDGDDCLEKTKALHPDLLFLDVQMPQRNGFEVLAALQRTKMPIVVFVTAYDKFAVKAFEYHALDYLLKPLKKTRFRECLARVQNQLLEISRKDQRPRLKRLLEYYQKQNPSKDGFDNAKGYYLQRVFVEGQGGSESIETDEIDYIEAADQYSKIHASGKVYLMSKPLSWFERELDPRQYVRIHRKHIVNLSKAKSFTISCIGSNAVTLRDGTNLSVSRRRLAKLRKQLDNS